jgi:hypothetical protein
MDAAADLALQGRCAHALWFNSDLSCLIPPLLENSVVFFSNSAVKR